MLQLRFRRALRRALSWLRFAARGLRFGFGASHLELNHHRIQKKSLTSGDERGYKRATLQAVKESYGTLP